MSELTRYEEAFNPNHAQECICRRRPMSRGLEVSAEGSYVDFEEYEKLEQQLEKAHERVTELQQTVAMLEKNLLRQSVFMEKTAEKLDKHREWQATASVLRRPTREAQQALNEFTIENKIKGVNWFSEKYCDDEHSFLADKAIEQLRKEQEQC